MNYQGTWLSHNVHDVQWQWSFDNNGNDEFTVPLSLRITAQIAGDEHTFYACDEITSFNASQVFPLNLDLCNASAVNLQSALSHNCSMLTSTDMKTAGHGTQWIILLTPVLVTLICAGVLLFCVLRARTKRLMQLAASKQQTEEDEALQSSKSLADLDSDIVKGAHERVTVDFEPARSVEPGAKSVLSPRIALAQQDSLKSQISDGGKYTLKKAAGELSIVTIVDEKKQSLSVEGLQKQRMQIHPYPSPQMSSSDHMEDMYGSENRQLSTKF
eukprot:CAMPEP_0202710040 /NCGR_PEP_ID=MMETSP1385-20130828/22075_1 /ASSEMBLY_ACC=CAM_ASM_000861 /TAXON_ID=933848 /ORGANISM="Elphidium margaritaceum" /LENGTH=271 /DNA_ID=CAMNT_0049369453 /DNA_START=45 /DNA_END=860 /DNA_ORIENTATION=+